MGTLSSAELEGKKVFAQQGREIGSVQGLDIDVEALVVKSIEVKVNRDILDELNLKRPLMGTQTMHLAVSHISAITDTVVLSATVEQLAVLSEEAADEG